MTKILVIEDEQEIREKIMKILEYEGYESLGAENGRIGVARAQKHSPDLIICDVLMPELGGFGVLMELRNDWRTASIPFIFLTAKSQPEDMRHGMSLGADDYLTKPFNMSDLLDAIQTRLAKHAEMTRQMEDLRLNLSITMPHELRTPLNGILGFTEFLLHFGQDLSLSFDEILEMQRSIHESALRLQHLIENYLLYANLRLLEYDQDQRELWEQNRLTSSTREKIRMYAHGKVKEYHRQQDLTCVLVDIDVQIPEAHFKKILMELLDNACKFSEPGTPIHVITSIEDSRYLLQIVDEGRGMTEEQIAHVGAYMQFERQYYEQQGAGLGLTLARMIAQLYGGEFTIESGPHTGTTVTVSFEHHD